MLVVDALTGQDAVNVAKGFAAGSTLTGVILTRLDGDARGGAASAMRAVTGKPIKFAGVGEEIDKFEAFHPDRVAGRILGMGDVVSLVERAAERSRSTKPRSSRTRCARASSTSTIFGPAAADAAHGRPRRARRDDARLKGMKGAGPGAG